MIVYLFSPMQEGRFLSKDNAMCALTQDISTPFVVYFLFIIIIIIVDI